MPYTYSFSHVPHYPLIYTFYPLKGDDDGDLTVFELYFKKLPQDDNANKENIMPCVNVIEYNNEPDNDFYSIKEIKIKRFSEKINEICNNVTDKAIWCYNMCKMYGSPSILLLFKRINNIDFSVLENDEISYIDKNLLVQFRTLLIASFSFGDVFDINKVHELYRYYHVVRYISNKFCIDNIEYNLDEFENGEMFG